MVIVPFTVHVGVNVFTVVYTHEPVPFAIVCPFPHLIETVVAFDVLQETFDVRGISPLFGVTEIELHAGVVVVSPSQVTLHFPFCPF